MEQETTVESVSKYYIGKVKHRAKKRGIPFLVSFEYLQQLYNKQKKMCPYLNVELTQTVQGIPGTASLDRKDSSLGYIKKNVQWVHKDINYMKGPSNEIDFLQNVIKINENIQNGIIKIPGDNKKG